MKNIVLALVTFLLSTQAIAGETYRTDKDLEMGDRYGVCRVVAQFDFGQGSDALLQVRAKGLCKNAYAVEIKRGFRVDALLNANTQIVNCFVCMSPK